MRMEMEYLNLKIQKYFIRENGQMDKKMVKEKKNMKMGLFILDNF